MTIRLIREKNKASSHQFHLSLCIPSRIDIFSFLESLIPIANGIHDIFTFQSLSDLFEKQHDTVIRIIYLQL